MHYLAHVFMRDVMGVKAADYVYGDKISCMHNATTPCSPDNHCQTTKAAQKSCGAVVKQPCFACATAWGSLQAAHAVRRPPVTRSGSGSGSWPVREVISH